MIAYFFIATILLSCAFSINLINKGNLKQKQLIHFFVITLLSCFIGLRGNHVGSDTITYQNIFSEISSYGDTDFHIEIGFLLLNQFVSWIGGNFNTLLFISVALPLFFILRTIRYFNIYNVFLSYYVLFCSSFLLIYLFSGIRQGIAIGFIFYSFKYIVNRELKFFILYILLASLFHFTSIIVLPLYWVIKKIPYFCILSLTIISFIAAKIGISKAIFMFLISFITGHYSAYANTYSDFGNSNTGLGIILRIFFWLSVLFILSKNINSKKTLVIYNILGIGVISYTFFLGVDVLIRLSEYCLVSLIIAIPYSLETINNICNRYLYLLLYSLFLILLLYSTLSFKDASLIPYNLGI